MNIDNIKTSALVGLGKAVEHLETEDGKKLLDALNVSLVSLGFTLGGARGLRKICRRFGVDLTRRESYGLIVAGAAVISSLDPGRAERIKRTLTKHVDRKKTITVNNRLG